MNIALIGYGKMGKAIEAVALDRGHRIGLKINSANIDAFTEVNLQQCDVAIEFTNPHSAVYNIEKCFKAGIPVVCGSTGWLEHWEIVQRSCEKYNGTLVYASNFSIGVNLFFELNKKLAALMNEQPGYDVQVTEIHHTQKKDAPSGTAITIAEQILATIKRKENWVNHTAANSSELEIISKRIDPAPGTHTVTYSSAIDDIAITHTAHNRTGFAGGAILAATFIAGKKGIFTMKDVLSLQ